MRRFLVDSLGELSNAKVFCVVIERLAQGVDAGVAAGLPLGLDFVAKLRGGVGDAWCRAVGGLGL